MFSLNSLNLVRKIFVITVKRLKATTCCVRDQASYHNASKTHVRDRIFKLSPIHASVIYQIPWIRWIHWIPAPFRENSIVSMVMLAVVPENGHRTHSFSLRFVTIASIIFENTNTDVDYKCKRVLKSCYSRAPVGYCSTNSRPNFMMTWISGSEPADSPRYISEHGYPPLHTEREHTGYKHRSNRFTAVHIQAWDILLYTEVLRFKLCSDWLSKSENFLGVCRLFFDLFCLFFDLFHLRCRFTWPEKALICGWIAFNGRQISVTVMDIMGELVTRAPSLSNWFHFHVIFGKFFVPNKKYDEPDSGLGAPFWKILNLIIAMLFLLTQLKHSWS